MAKKKGRYEPIDEDMIRNLIGGWFRNKCQRLPHRKLPHRKFRRNPKSHGPLGNPKQTQDIIKVKIAETNTNVLSCVLKTAYRTPLAG